jgi:hypothetical protein
MAREPTGDSKDPETEGVVGDEKDAETRPGGWSRSELSCGRTNGGVAGSAVHQLGCSQQLRGQSARGHRGRGRPGGRRANSVAGLAPSLLDIRALHGFKAFDSGQLLGRLDAVVGVDADAAH